jgi:hypothetical protein
MPPRRFTHLLQFSTTSAQSDAFDRVAETMPLYTRSDLLRLMLDAFLREQGALSSPRPRGNGHDMANGQMEQQ